MYAKAMQNYEEVEEKNAEKFDEEPTGAFTEWFKFCLLYTYPSPRDTG